MSRRDLRAVSTACAALGALAFAAPGDAQVYTRRDASGVIEATNIPGGRGFRLTYPGKGRLIHSSGFSGRYRGEFDTIIDDAGRAFGIDGALIHAVIRAESSYDRYAVSSKGARGLMQLMPATARRFGVADSFDPRQNIFAGVKYLRLLLDMFGGDVGLALAGYNAGENAVKRWKGIPPYRETRRYVRKIQGWLPRMRARPSLSYVPSASQRAVAASGPLEPAIPRTYYRYHDAAGVLRVTSQAPPEGVTYSTIRALR